MPKNVNKPLNLTKEILELKKRLKPLNNMLNGEKKIRTNYYSDPKMH